MINNSPFSSIDERKYLTVKNPDFNRLLLHPCIGSNLHNQFHSFDKTKMKGNNTPICHDSKIKGNEKELRNQGIFTSNSNLRINNNSFNNSFNKSINLVDHSREEGTKQNEEIFPHRRNSEKYRKTYKPYKLSTFAISPAKSSQEIIEEAKRFVKLNANGPSPTYKNIKKILPPIRFKKSSSSHSFVKANAIPNSGSKKLLKKD